MSGYISETNQLHNPCFPITIACFLCAQIALILRWPEKNINSLINKLNLKS